MGNALSGENVIFVRCYVKSESWILLRVVRISISEAFFSDPKTEADFFNTIGQQRTFSLLTKTANRINDESYARRFEFGL